MRPKSFVLLGLALGCGLIASIGISQVMEKNRGDTAGIETEPIYTAKTNINIGDPITAEQVRLVEYPKENVPAGAIRDLADLEDRRPRSTVFAGEILLDAKLTNPGEMGDDALSGIPPGYRAVPISVKADTGAAGLLRPGDRVDVQWYVSKNRSLGINETVTKIILHNIRVFAIDQTVNRTADGEEAPTLAKTISLLLTPQQASKVSLANKIGEVSLIPRHPDDEDSEDAAEVSLDILLTGTEKGSREREQQATGEDDGGEEKGFFASWLEKAKAGIGNAAMAAPPKPPWIMEIVSGDEVEFVEFSPIDGRPLQTQGKNRDPGPEPNGGSMSPYGAPKPGGLKLPRGVELPDDLGSGTRGEGNEDDFPIDL